MNTGFGGTEVSISQTKIFFIYLVSMATFYET